MTTLLGFDYGLRKIGVAVGQTITGTANALTTLAMRGQRPDWRAIEALVREWQPIAAVVGLPMNMDDTEEDWADQVRRFARQLHGRFGLAVHLVDERLTTREAQRQLGLGPGRDLRVDAFAAKLILETWLAEAESARCDGAGDHAAAAVSHLKTASRAAAGPREPAPPRGDAGAQTGD